jgi:hypothetical protein
MKLQLWLEVVTKDVNSRQKQAYGRIRLSLSDNNDEDVRRMFE